MTNLQFDRLSARQLEVLGQVSVGNDGGHPGATLRALVNRGLIERYEEGWWEGNVHGVTYRYRMPVSAHIRWCDWCATHPEEVDQ